MNDHRRLRATKAGTELGLLAGSTGNTFFARGGSEWREPNAVIDGASRWAGWPVMHVAHLTDGTRVPCLDGALPATGSITLAQSIFERHSRLSMSDTCLLTRAFIDALPDSARGSVDEELGATLAQALDQAYAAYPAVDVARELLVFHAAQRWGDRSGSSEDVAALHWPDLLLACACAFGDDGAVELFERELGPVIDSAVRRLDGPAAERAEAAQIARGHLLVAEANTPPRIAQYSGRAPLSSYVRVVASRVALRMLRKQPRGRQVGDDILVAVAHDSDDPEIAYLKTLYREEFRGAFAAAVDSLSPRDRALLRYQLVDRLDLAALSKIYSTPRSTIGRHAQQARARLIEGTRNHLRKQLSVTPSELDSVLRLVESSADVSVSRLLREGAPSET